MMMMMTMLMMMMMLPNFSLRRQSSKRRGVSHSYQDKKVRKKKCKKTKKSVKFFFLKFFVKTSKNVQRTESLQRVFSLFLSLSLSLCIVKETKEF